MVIPVILVRLVIVFMFRDISVTALHTARYAMIPDRIYDVIYGGASVVSFYNRTSLTIAECAGKCEDADACGGFNFCEVSGDARTCESLEASPGPIDPTKLWHRPGCLYYHKWGDCFNGGIMTTNNTCACALGFTNTHCEDYVQDCAVVYKQGYRKRHIMTIQPHQSLTVFKVECRLQEGPVTRILMREQNQTDNFENNGWNNFKNGFWYPWNPNGWIGLDKLHSILINSPYNHTAKVTVIFQNDTTEYTGYYGNFFVDSEENSYTLTYMDFWAGANQLEDGLSGLNQNESANGRPFCPMSLADTCSGCSTTTGRYWWFGSACDSVNLFSALGELVWPKASLFVPIDVLYVDIIAVLS